MSGSHGAKIRRLDGICLGSWRSISFVPERGLCVLDEFGRDLGVALQMFDDLGNVQEKNEPAKQYEDLLLHRPSWVWACAAEDYPPDGYRRFIEVVRKLPEREPLERWFERTGLIETCRRRALEHMNASFEALADRLDRENISWSDAKCFGNFEAWEQALRQLTSKPRAAVIGSGFGGLAVAIRLQAAGVRTVIFEKRDLAGGRAYVYRDAGFTFDAGPTVITAPDCLRELFALSGRVMDDYVTLLPVSPFYRLFWEDGFKFDYSNDSAEIEAQIDNKSPRDVRWLQTFSAIL